MPKDLLELDTFEVGLITNPSEQDVPEEAATFSRNIDSFNSDGALAGIADDVKLTGFPTGSFTGSSTQAVPTTINCQVAKSINDDGVERVVMYESTSGGKNIRKIDGFNQAGPTGMNELLIPAGALNSSNEDVCMEVNNKEVHIGMGSDLADAPKWAGIISEGQFGGAAPSGLQGVNAELTAASSFTTMDHIVADTGVNYIFGCEMNNTNNPKIYKFKVSTGSLVMRSDADNEFTEISGMCIWDTGQPDQYIVVLDQTDTNTYTLSLVSQLNLEIVKVWQVSGLEFATATQLLHIHNTTPAKSKFYVARHDIVSTYDTDNRAQTRLYGALAPAIEDTDTQAFSEMSFKTNFGTEGVHTDANFYRTPGTFQYFNTEGGHAHWDGDEVLFGNHFRDNMPGGGGYNILFKPYGVSASSANPKVGMCAQFMMHDISPNHTDSVHGDTRFCYSNAASITDVVGDGAIPLISGGAPTDRSYSQPCIVYVNYNLANGALLVPEYDTTVADNTTGCIIPLQFSALGTPVPGASSYFEVYSYIQASNTGHTTRSMLTRLSSSADDESSKIEAYNIPSVTELSNWPVWDSPNFVPIDEIFTTAEIDLAGPSALPDVIGGNTGFHAFSSAVQARWASGYGTNAANYVAESQSDIGLDTTLRSSGGSLPDNTKFFYKVSYTYDGYQESPLTTYILDDATTGSSGNNDKVQLDIEFILPSNLTRVTHLNVYAASSSSSADVVPQGFYRLVKQLPLDQSWGESATNTTPDYGIVRDKVLFHRSHNGASYEARTGISSAVNSTTVNYGLSCQLNNHHIVTNASNDYLDGSNYMFKSKPYNFDQFDWTTDLLRLPQKPTALAGFQGRIYCFTENKIFKVELNNFFIEDTFDGIGCSGPEAVCVTEYGMFWCDKHNMYMNDGSQVLPIGNAVRENTDGNTSYRWQINKAGAKTRVYYNAKKGVVLFEYQTATTGPTYFYAWNVAKSRWDFYEFKSAMNQSTGTEVDGMFLSQAGDTVAVVNDGLYKLFDSDDLTRAWTWISKNHSMGTPTQNKKFKKLRVRGSPVGSINQSSNHTGQGIGLDINGANASASGTVDEMKLSSKFKLVQLRMVGQTGVVDSVGYVFKRKPVH